jgi:hypothetical protein
VSLTVERFGLAVSVLIGVTVRVVPIIDAGGPVGDGGLIMAMVDDIRAAGLATPEATSYNHLDIPFVYPPAALFSTAAIGEALGIPTIDLMRWAPLVLSVLTLVAFAWVATRLLNPAAAASATLAYGLMPSAYGWVVAGGGLPRGAGLVFALLAAGLVAANPKRQPAWINAVGAGVFLGFSLLCHPQAAILGVFACVAFSWQRPARAWLLNVVAAAAIAFVITIPWLASLFANGSLDALFRAGSRLEPGLGLIRLINLRFSAAPFMDVLVIAAGAGLIASLARRRFRLPLLLVMVYLVGAGGGGFLAAPVWALLAGSGIMSLAFLLRRALEDASPALRRTIMIGTAASAFFLALIGSLGSVTDQSSKLHPLGPELVHAMQWVNQNTSGDTRFLIPTDEVWGFDDVSEWFPAIADRSSIGTVQGSEWLGSAGFDAQLERQVAIQNCVGHTASCYAAIGENAALFIPKGKLNGLFSPSDCCPALRFTLSDAGYRVVYDGPGATIAAPGPTH